MRPVNSWLLAVILILLIVASTVAEDVAREKVQPATGGPVVRGGVVILKEAMTKSVSINVGGLLVVQIPDSQSHPPQGITVKASSGDARSLGHVRGVRSTDGGQTLFGGGYTWYLFCAVRQTDSLQINVSYLPNGTADPKRINRTHRIEIQSE